MRVVCTGVTGFIGPPLVDRLTAAGHEVVILSRSPASGPPRRVVWTPGQAGDWERELDGADAVIHLAGKNIFEDRWNESVKAGLRSSRIESTRSIAAAIGRASRRPRVLVNASAIGYYGPRGDEELDEAAAAGTDFLATLVVDWEKEAAAAEAHGVRVVRLRFGIVIHPSGGALAQMLPYFKAFIGGPLGNGRQWFSWVSREDVVGAILFALEREDLRGPANVTSPHPMPQADFCKALGAALGRPSWLPVPGFAVRIKFGEVADALLASQRVVPRVLEKTGFEFKHPDAECALRQMMGGL